MEEYFELHAGDRVICDFKNRISLRPMARHYYNCRMGKNNAVLSEKKFKIVSLPDSNAVYIDGKSVFTKQPKIVFNIGSDQACKTVKWRNSGLDMLSCFHE